MASGVGDCDAGTDRGRTNTFCTHTKMPIDATKPTIYHHCGIPFTPTYIQLRITRAKRLYNRDNVLHNGLAVFWRPSQSPILVAFNMLPVLQRIAATLPPPGRFPENATTNAEDTRSRVLVWSLQNTSNRMRLPLYSIIVTLFVKYPVKPDRRVLVENRLDWQALRSEDSWLPASTVSAHSNYRHTRMFGVVFPVLKPEFSGATGHCFDLVECSL